MQYPSFTVELPEWASQLMPEPGRAYEHIEQRMQLALELARINVAHETGGPFAAAVFEQETGRLVAPGVNMVETAGCCVLHAEMVALTLAQARLGTFDLGAEGLPAMELVTTTEPCTMCLGAVIWSGVRRLVCGARDEDAREIGFDEGPKPERWPAQLETRGITVMRDICRTQGRALLMDYRDSGGLIYNPHRPGAAE